MADVRDSDPRFDRRARRRSAVRGRRLRDGVVRAKVATGSAPRTLALAADGRALYVVNYESGTVTKLRTSDMKPLQTIDACYHAIGITYARRDACGWRATRARSASTTIARCPS